MTAYEKKSEKLALQAKPVVEQVFSTQSDKYVTIAFPITDGERGIITIINLEEGVKTQGKLLPRTVEKLINLSFIDNEWKDHLRQMDDLRTSVLHASIEQKDPLVIY